ncbi:MAG: hypothetical protein EBS05_19650 [Proteobacteria bacterium]|nr:hypothetical protein [Pseudomonadota bacterium]
MRMGDSVPGILTDEWKFVAEDAHRVAERVREYDRDCRLAVHVPTHQLGVARWTVASFAEGGAWMIAFRCRDPETGEPMIGEPDERVLWLMDRFDMWKQANPGRLAKAAAEIQRRRAEHLEEADRERNAEMAEKFVRGWKLKEGIKDKIYVPAGAGGIS